MADLDVSCVAGQPDLLTLHKMKVADLKKELKARGLSSTGNKTELLERLQRVLQTGVAVADDPVDDFDVEDDATEDLEDIVLAEDVKDDIPIPSQSTLVLSTSQELEEASMYASTLETEKVVPTKIALKRPILTDIGEITSKPKNVPPSPTPKITTTEDKLVVRAQRFSLPATEAEKKKLRAERFGISDQVSSKSAITSSGGAGADKLKQRAERFGISLKVSTGATADDQVRLLKRKERFGASTIAKIYESDEKKQKRAERFGIV